MSKKSFIFKHYRYMNFDYLYSKDDFVTFLNKTVARVLFDKRGQDKPLLFRNTVPLGSIRLMQKRASRKNCTLAEVETIFGFECYNLFLSLGENKSMIGNGSLHWHYYREDSDAATGNGFTGISLGEIESYDKGGYIIDIPFN